MQDHWDHFVTIYHGGFLISRLVQTATADFTDVEKAKEIEDFFAVHPAPAAERAVKQSIEKIHSNARWLATDGEAIGKWLADWYEPHQSSLSGIPAFSQTLQGGKPLII